MRRALIRSILMACVAGGPFAAVCWAAAPAALVRAPAQTRVTDAHMRAPRAGFASTSLAVTLLASSDVRLTGARLEGARQVELRSMTREGEVVTAVRVPSIELPAGVPVELRIGRGGFHLVALGMRGPVIPGRPLKLWLDLQDAGSGRTRTISATMRVLPPRGLHADDDH